MKPLKILEGHQNDVNFVSVHKNNFFLASGGLDKYLLFWEPMEIFNANQEEAKFDLNENQFNNEKEIPQIECKIL